MWNPPWIVISKPSNTLPNGTQEIAAFTVPTMCSAVIRLEVGEVCIPQRGGKKSAEQEALERSPAFKKSSTIPGRHRGPYLRKRFAVAGMERCRAKGRERFEMLVGAAVLANNLLRIAQLIEDRKRKRRRAAAYVLLAPCLPLGEVSPILATHAVFCSFRPFLWAIYLPFECITANFSSLWMKHCNRIYLSRELLPDIFTSFATETN